MRILRREVDVAIDVGHAAIEFLMEGGDISGQAGLGPFDGCFDSGLCLWKRVADAFEGFPGLGLNVSGDISVQGRQNVFVRKAFGS